MSLLGGGASQSFLLHVQCVHTLADVEETGGEDCRAEEPQEDGAADQFEAGVFSLWTKPLPDAVQGDT